MSDKHAPHSPHEWISRWKQQASLISSSHRLTDQTWSKRFNDDVRQRNSAALTNILQHKSKELPVSLVEIDGDGQAVFNLPITMTKPLGLGNQPMTITTTSTDFQNPAVRTTHGLAIWLKESLFESGKLASGQEFNRVIQPQIVDFCNTLAATHGITIYPAFIPINSSTDCAGSILVLMSDQEGQKKLLADVRKALMREITTLRYQADDPSRRPPSPQR